MLVRCSPDFRFRFVSPAYAKMLGLPPEQIVGKMLSEVIGKKAFDEIRPYITQALRGERAEYEAAIEFDRIGIRHLHGVYTPDIDGNGRVTGWIASIVDVTDRKRAELQRDLLIAEINHRVSFSSGV
jgi:PAS domain S-box-containing protein